MNYDNKFYEDLIYRSFVGVTQSVIDYLSNNKEKIFDLRKLGWHHAPCDIEQLLEENGWEEV